MAMGRWMVVMGGDGCDGRGWAAMAVVGGDGRRWLWWAVMGGVMGDGWRSGYSVVWIFSLLCSSGYSNILSIL